MNIHKKPIARIRLVKWIVAIVALVFLYYEIFVRHEALELLSSYSATVEKIWPSIMIVLLLMPVNWLLESIKWRRLMVKTTNVALPKILKGVLMGVSLGLFTPNGVGEFAGRMWVVRKRYREQAVSSSIVGSLSQLCITITIGGALIVFYASRLIAQEWLLVSQILAVVTVIFGFWMYYKMPEIAAKVLHRIKLFNRFNKFRESMASFSKKELTEAYFLSLLRYIVFCTQLCILIISVGNLDSIQIPLVIGLIPVYYYVQTLIPTIALSEIGVRGLILLVLFSGLLIESEVILISFLIWMINLIIPGIVGLVFLAKTRFVKQ